MITPTGALILLVPALPIALWATYSDMKTLKIPNKAVLALAAVWPLLGWIAVPTWTAWAWGFAFLVLGFVIGYLAFALFNFPGGDAKYAAAMSPIFVGADWVFVLQLVLGCMLGATILHQVVRLIPVVRRMAPDWESWKHWRMVPFGLALSAMLLFYLGAAAWPQV